MDIDLEIREMIIKGGFKNQKDLSLWAGKSESYVTKWKKQGFIPQDIKEKFESEFGELIDKEVLVHNSNTINIPYFENTYGAMGIGGLSYDTQPTVMSFDKNFLKSIFGISSCKNLHIINAVGDSMSPTISSGEMLFINPFENENNIIKDRGIYVIVSHNGILVKRIKIHPTKKQWILVSDNAEDDDIELMEDEIDSCKVIGRVVGHFDRI
jgi:repressor LexA